jgi:amidohydrolase
MSMIVGKDAMDSKDQVRNTIAQNRQGLVALSRRIYEHPEVGYQEQQACAWVAEALATAGFHVRIGVGDLPTALLATYGSGPLHLGICAEYDAMAEGGHVCGHHLIAAMAVGAALGLAPLVEALGIRVSVIGTPAEEGGGGKIVLLSRGVFAGLHMAMMVHPSPVDIVEPPTLAMSQLHIRFTGRAARAPSFPERGIDAADAMVVAQVGLGLLHEHLPQSVRVSGIVTKAGDEPSLVPEEATAHYIVWASTLAELMEARERVCRCFQAGAQASGAACSIVTDREPGAGQPYAELRHDHEIAALYRRNAEALGRTFPDVAYLAARAAMCTDMGNVSQAIPTIHPMIGVGGKVLNHEPGFDVQCMGPAGEQALFDGATAMAWTAIDMATSAGLRSRLLAEQVQVC